MATARSAWGIDLGNRALKAVKLVRDGDRFRIDDFDIIEHEQVLAVAGDNKEPLLKSALARFVERHQTKGSFVGVGVSGQSSFARFIKLPPVEPKRIPEIVRFEAIQQIPFPLDDVEWAYQLFQEKDSPDVEVGLFAMRKELVNRHIAYFTDLGLNVQVVQMNPLAVYNAMYYDDQTGQASMFMDSGAENTDLIIAEGQTVWLRTIPIGGNNFTDTLAKAFKLNFAKAEELKRNAATSKYAKQIFQAMRPVFADLVAEIQRSIGFYASVHRDARIARLVALGSTFQLPGLQKYLQQNLQLPVEKLGGFKSLPPKDARLAAELSENCISLAGAYGLALQAMGDAKISSSLLPEKIRRIKMWQEKTPKFAAAAAMFVAGALGVGASYFYNESMRVQNQNHRNEYTETLQLARGLIDEWRNNVEGKGHDDLAKVKGMEALLNYREVWPEILSAIATSVPPERPLSQLAAVPRGQREQIEIQAILSQYWPDLTTPLDPKGDFSRFQAIDVSGRADGMRVQPPGMMMTPTLDPGVPTVAPPRGYLISIRGITPNRGGAGYVDRVMVKKLLEHSAIKQFTANRRWYVAKAEIVKAGPRAVPQPTSTMGGSFSPPPRGAPGGGFGPVTPPPMPSYGSMPGAGTESIDADVLAGDEAQGLANQPMMPAMPAMIDPRNPGAMVAKPPPDPLQCPFFPKETIKEDVDFTVLIAIVLDPPHPGETPADAAGEAATPTGAAPPAAGGAARP